MIDEEKNEVTVEALKQVIAEHADIEILVAGQQHLFREVNTQGNNQRLLLRKVLAPTLLAIVILGVIFGIYSQGTIPLSGDFSITTMTLAVAGGMGGLLFAIALVVNKRRQAPNLQQLVWRHIPTIIFSFWLILLIGLAAFLWLIGLSFEGASFDKVTATVIAALFAGFVNYVMLLAVDSINDEMLTNLLILVSVGGIVASMVTNSQRNWWQKNFSYLGTESAYNSWQFNVTLMVSALLLVALIDYLFVDLVKASPQKVQLWILRIMLTMTAISLGAVGFFPNNGQGRLHELHNLAANWLVYWIILLILGIRWLLPRVTREFLTVSYGIAGTLLVANFLFQTIGYLSLTAFEIIAFFLAFSWILLLVQNIRKLHRRPRIVIEIAAQTPDASSKEV